MNFLNPFMLGGLAALSIPVVIHFMNRFRVQTTEWAAMRFLQQSIRQDARRLKLQDLLLLLLRLLLVALAVLAFARPVQKAFASPEQAGKGAVASMVLLDNSASMGCSLGAELCIDRAKRDIAKWADEMDSQSLLGLCLVSNRAEPLIPKPGPNTGLFRKMLAEAPLSDRGSDLLPGLRFAVESLKNIHGMPREIRIFTDGQGAAWLKSAEILKLANANPGIRFVPVIIADKLPANLGIVDVSPESGTVAALQPARIRVEVANHGDSPVQDLRVNLFSAEGRPVGESVIASIEPGASVTTSIATMFEKAGPNSISATIPPDAFATDNRRSAALDVVSQMNILICEEHPTAEPTDRDGFYLANALMPIPSEEAPRHFMSLLFTSPADLPGELSSAVHAVFLCNPGSLPIATAGALREYVQHGGSVVVFPGSQTSAEDWMANAALAGLLPATLGPPTGDDEGAKGLAWQSGDFNHPITELWNDLQQGRLSAIKVFRHFPLVPKPEARVIATLSDGSPVAVESRSGEGAIVVFATPATPDWSNLPLHPAFVPLTQRLLGYMNRGKGSRLSLLPGEAFRKVVPSELNGEEFTVKRPDSESARSAGQVASDEGQTYVRYALTEKAGIYHMSVGADPIASFAVQLDPAESDLHKADPALFTSLHEIKPATEEATQQQLVITREYWTLLIWIAVAFFILEAFFAHFFSHARTA
ncbi:BatA domain-containing protein [Luteolibacter sp. Populi]|uniref:BatA domain-containing protein n=1 Tax=Luteolibacter sp. Populi TaxID=3230487 RepID=UPI0034672CAB